MSKPKRRYEVNLKLGADSLNDVIGALNGLLYELHSKKEDEPIQMITGGYSYGYVLTADIDPQITHDSYEVTLMDYIAEEKTKANKET